MNKTTTLAPGRASQPVRLPTAVEAAMQRAAAAATTDRVTREAIRSLKQAAERILRDTRAAD